MIETKISETQENIDWMTVTVVTGASGIFAASVGLSYPLLSIILGKMGFNATLIGINAAMTPLGAMASAVLTPRFSRRLGPLCTALIWLAFAAVSLSLMGKWRSLYLWFPARFMFGIFTGGVYILVRAWINQIAARGHRGRLLAIYATVLAAGFATGPFLVAMTGSEGWRPFLFGIGALVLSTGGLSLVAKRLPGFSSGSEISIAQFARMAPVLLLAASMYAVFDKAMLALLPRYASHFALKEREIGIALGFLYLGNVFLQFPIGWIADRFPRRLVIAGCSVIALICCAALPVFIGHLVLLCLVLPIWGAVAYGLTTVSHAELGERLKGDALLAGTAAMAMTAGFGGILGPFAAGGAMDLIGPEGLPMSLGIGFAVLAGLAVVCGLMRKTISSDAGELARSMHDRGYPG